MDTFIAIGENIHCTRSFKRGGAYVMESPQPAVLYHEAGQQKALPIPEPFLSTAEWRDGKVRHCAVAAFQGLRGQGAQREAGTHYIQALARSQEQAGAAFLDINVDEFGANVQDRIAAVEWAVRTVRTVSALPLSIDSSNPDVIRAGLEAWGRDVRPWPLVNSFSLERLGLLDLLKAYRPAVVVSAAGARDLPVAIQDRMNNVSAALAHVTAAGIPLNRIYVDPLVYTISTDSANGRICVEAVAAIRKTLGPEIHITGGFSNVSFGMPARKLINQVFTWLCVQAGADSGIVDPLQINAALLKALDPASEPFRLARALLLGEDEFGVEFIAAHREGRIAS